MTERVTELDHRRESWGPGPWNDEPDRVEWRDGRFDNYGLLVVRGPMGALCGYVGVPPGHPDHGKDWTGLDLDEPPHGGLTYSARCSGLVCHVPAPGEPDDVWWFGFDCGHSLDLVPTMAHLDRMLDGLGLDGAAFGVYRDLSYVVAETRALAETLWRRAK